MPIDPAMFPELPPAPIVVQQQAARHGQRPRFYVGDAVRGWQSVGWDAYAKAMAEIALGMDSWLQPGERAAIAAPNSVAWASAAVGIQAIGGVMVPIYPASTAEQMAYVLRHATARVLFVAGPELLEHTGQIWAELPDVRAVVVMDDVPLPAALREDSRVHRLAELQARGAASLREDPDALAPHLARLRGDGPALMLYTSGSTGRPKGVPLTHDNLGTNAADWLRCNAPLLREGAIDLQWLPMSHIFGFGEICSGNVLGWVSYLSSPRRVLEDMPTVAPHVLMSVPAYWDKIAKATLARAEGVEGQAARTQAFAEVTGGRLEFCLSGGAGLDIGVKELALACGCLILEGYGLTECAPTLTLNRPDNFRFDSVGQALPSVTLRLAADDEIQAKGPNVFAGYHDDPDATAAAFTDDGWFRTGDLGQIDEDGFVRIIGRKKEILVTTGGKNVAPGNIEARFAAEPLVAQAVVYGDGKKYLVAGLWLDSAVAGTMTPEQIAEQLDAAVQRVNRGLARFEQIKRYAPIPKALTVADGMLTPTLKLRRNVIYAEFRDTFEALYR